MNNQNMSYTARVQPDACETRDVHGFKGVSLSVQNLQNDIVIRQGDCESLTIEAPPDLLARIKTGVSAGELAIRLTGSWSDLVKEALSTSLSRQRIRYTLTVRQLIALNITGLVHLEADRLETDRLVLRFAGPGTARLASLHARLLEVDIAGPCKVEVGGKVEEQRLSVSAIGFYYAPRLESQKAVVRLNGPSQATIWATEMLDATVNGPGRLEYYGAPRIRQRTTPFGGLVNLGKPVGN